LLRFSSILGALLLSASPSCSPAQDMPRTTETTRAPQPAASGPIARYFSRAGDEGNVSDLLAAAVEAVSVDDGWERSRLPEVLRSAGLFPPMPAGRSELIVPVGHGSGRRVLLQLPKGYDPARPWPLLIAYHSGGGAADGMLSSAVRMLGARANDFVVAAPHHYRQTGLDHPRPVSSEHAEVLRTIKERVDVDSDRVYVTGFSTGGYTTWFLAALQPDLFAGAVPMAAAFSVPMDEPGLAEAFLPNLRYLPVLSVWGGRDTLNVPGLNGRRTRDTMADLNRRLGPMLRSEGLDDVIHHEVPRAGHGGYSPPAGPLAEVLSAERVHAPTPILHRFRYVHQGHAYWVEGHEWSGELWADMWPPKGRSPVDMLGEIRAEATSGPDGTMLEVMTKHLGDLTAWLDDALVADWSKPVTVIHGGRQVFQGVVEPDLAVALSQARRTRDLDRIRWAGIRIDATAGKARVVTAQDDFPPVLREVLGR
jgi:pimeloyl-ACP methyl ester carboxylesterase